MENYPSPSQIRREWERRANPFRQYTPCQTEEHLIENQALAMTSTRGLRQMLTALQVRLDVPSYLVDPCSCGGGVPTSKWG